jgi:hypothetical protein
LRIPKLKIVAGILNTLKIFSGKVRETQTLAEKIKDLYKKPTPRDTALKSSIKGVLISFDLVMVVTFSVNVL